MNEKYHTELFLRPADINDMDILFRWANDEAVRNSAFHSDSISFPEHQKWFLQLLRNEQEKQYIMMYGNEPIGQVRLSILGNKAEIDYSIDANQRGMGYGKKIITLIIDEVQMNFPLVDTLIGKVKRGNTASEKCFCDRGFKIAYTQFELKLSEDGRWPNM